MSYFYPEASTSTKRQTREDNRKPQPSEAGLKGNSPDSTASKKTQTRKVVPPARYSQEA